MPNPFKSQDLNRFAYVRSNPVRYTDPTGHMLPCEPGDVCRHPDPTPSPAPGPQPEPDPDPMPDPNPIPSPAPTPAPQGVNNYDCFTYPYSCGIGMPSPENTGSPLISIVGLMLTTQLGILDMVLGFGIVDVAITAFTVPGAQLGLAGELVLLPLEAVSLSLTVYAAQMAATGTLDHDPLVLIHGFFPGFLPYEP